MREKAAKNISLIKLLEVKWLSHMIDVCLTFQKAAKLFSNMVATFTFPLGMYESSTCSVSSPTLGIPVF